MYCLVFIVPYENLAKPMTPPRQPMASAPSTGAVEHHEALLCLLSRGRGPIPILKATEDFFNCRNMEVMQWPAYSSDMSPIETIWAVIKCKLRKVSLKSKLDPINAFLNICVRNDSDQEQ